ncbi:hypothetical protein F4680DRAFT_142207 [Xylaria scruposa]|nr:hypothetical protein F4680DRAFT_142207 [Xylaria scruposa]
MRQYTLPFNLVLFHCLFKYSCSAAPLRHCLAQRVYLTVSSHCSIGFALDVKYTVLSVQSDRTETITSGSEALALVNAQLLPPSRAFPIWTVMTAYEVRT